MAAFNIWQEYTPLCGPHGLPVPAHTGPVLDINYVIPAVDTIAGPTRPPDYGDVQVAWHNVGLASTAARPNAPKPDRERVANYVARVIRHISVRPLGPSAAAWSARRRRLKKALMAARTLLQIRMPIVNFKQNPIELRVGDVELFNTTFWHRIPAPLPYPAINAHLTAHRANLDNLELQYRDAVRQFPSRIETFENNRRFLAEFRSTTGKLMTFVLRQHTQVQ